MSEQKLTNLLRARVCQRLICSIINELASVFGQTFSSQFCSTSSQHLDHLHTSYSALSGTIMHLPNLMTVGCGYLNDGILITVNKHLAGLSGIKMHRLSRFLRGISLNKLGFYQWKNVYCSKENLYYTNHCANSN